jgi:hypothetical protein
LAEGVGTKQSAISRIEKGQETNWELETLVRLAEEMGARLAVIFEPYEIVAARYRMASRSPEPSAATADTASPQPSRGVPSSNEQAPRQDKIQTPALAKKEGDPLWN